MYNDALQAQTVSADYQPEDAKQIIQSGKDSERCEILLPIDDTRINKHVLYFQV